MYEVTILGDSADREARIIVVPVGQFGIDIANINFVQELQVRKVAEVSPSNLTRSLAVLFSGVPADDRSGFLASPETITNDVVTKYDVQFAEAVAFDRVVPIEESPLTADVLVTLVTKATGAGLGAYVGFVAFGAASPFLLITVPAGMIICGAAKGVADALEKGLRDRLTALIRGKTPKSLPRGKQQTPTIDSVLDTVGRSPQGTR
jgi:hypothetical protein